MRSCSKKNVRFIEHNPNAPRAQITQKWLSPAAPISYPYTPSAYSTLVTLSPAFIALASVNLAADPRTTTTLGLEWSHPITNPAVPIILVESNDCQFPWLIKADAANPSVGVTVGDLLLAMHRNMHYEITRMEWKSFREESQVIAEEMRLRRMRYPQCRADEDSWTQVYPQRIDVLGGER